MCARKKEGTEVTERLTPKRLVMALAGIASAATVAFAVAFAAPAMAATAAPGAPAVTHPAAHSLPRGFEVAGTTTGSPTITRVNATTSCGTTPVDAVHGSYYGITVWWVKMQTRWCWNGNTVTSHSTSVSHWVTGSYHYNASYSFSCPNGCRENSENLSGSPMVYFQSGSVGYAWNVHLWQNEFYNGAWNAGWSSTGYPF
jgi:hypothetical protein